MMPVRCIGADVSEMVGDGRGDQTRFDYGFV